MATVVDSKNKRPNETAQMLKLIWTFVLHICPENTLFPIDKANM